MVDIKKVTNLALFDKELSQLYLDNAIDTETPLYLESPDEILILPARWQNIWMKAPYWNGETWICAICQKTAKDKPSFVKCGTTLLAATFFTVNSWLHPKCAADKRMNEGKRWKGCSDPSEVAYTEVRNGSADNFVTPVNPDMEVK